MNIQFMREAIREAMKGIGFTNPNPLVGAVIVKDNKIISRGYHECYGELHAERNAILNAKDDLTCADMYVTLEPCSHYGKQPPCTEAIVEAGIKRVYIGSGDPNPEVCGKGIEYLKKHGIEVYEGILKDECDSINEIFFHYITKRRPYVISKIAMTADGKIATSTGDSKWITNELSRQNVHNTRKRVSAIMVGINTVITDNPMLDCRCENPANPIRIICDSNLRIPMDCNIVKTAHDIKTIIATVSDDKDKIEKLENKGIVILKTAGERINIDELLTKLGELKIDSVLVEGGAQLHWSILSEGLADKLQVYIAPKIIGGNDSKTAVGGVGFKKVCDGVMFENPQISVFGNDVLIEYKKAR